MTLNAAWLHRYANGEPHKHAGRIRRIWHYSRGYWETAPCPFPFVGSTLHEQLTAAGYAKQPATRVTYWELYALTHRTEHAYPTYVVVVGGFVAAGVIVLLDDFPDALCMLERLQKLVPLFSE